MIDLKFHLDATERQANDTVLFGISAERKVIGVTKTEADRLVAEAEKNFSLTEEHELIFGYGLTLNIPYFLGISGSLSTTRADISAHRFPYLLHGLYEESELFIKNFDRHAAEVMTVLKGVLIRTYESYRLSGGDKISPSNEMGFLLGDMSVALGKESALNAILPVLAIRMIADDTLSG
jgi:hypothetical protein